MAVAISTDATGERVCCAVIAFAVAKTAIATGLKLFGWPVAPIFTPVTSSLCVKGWSSRSIFDASNYLEVRAFVSRKKELSKMKLAKVLLVAVCLLVAFAGRVTHAQGCASGQDAAVECFVGNAVRTNIIAIQFGMTMQQFKGYGVSVSKIVQSQPTSLAIVGLASAVADALPPTNADGSANQAAQSAAMNSIVDAGIANGFLNLPAETNAQDLKWFSLDLVRAMNANNGILLSPGTMLRVIDSYVVSSMTNGTVNWTLANSGIATMMNSLASTGFLKLPPAITPVQARQFAQSLAQITFSYRTATNRSSL
jgi:hypothetical protein